MKTGIISGILLLVLITYLVIPALPVIDYLINKEFIAKTLCINKDKPKSCCKGKCHMVKQLQKTNQDTDKNTKNTSNRVQLKELNEFVINNSCHLNLEVSIVNYHNFNILAFNKLAPHAIFVPPKAVSSIS